VLERLSPQLGDGREVVADRGDGDVGVGRDGAMSERPRPISGDDPDSGVEKEGATRDPACKAAVLLIGHGILSTIRINVPIVEIACKRAISTL
jgi:hypothetical protein